MKGVLSIYGTPFRFGGILRRYDLTTFELLGEEKDCYVCGCDMSNRFPYTATYRIIKGEDVGMCRFHILCRECAYKYKLGVIEMDGETYRNLDDFREREYKDKAVSEWHERHEDC